MTDRYTVMSPLRVDSRLYQPGEVVEIADSDTASELVADGIIEPAGEAEDEAPAPPASVADDVRRLHVLVTGAARLDPSVPDDWTRDGRPTTQALSRMLEAATDDDRDVSAAERDRVWDLVTTCRSEPEARVAEAEALARAAEGRAEAAEGRAEAAEGRAEAAEEALRGRAAAKAPETGQD